LALSFPYTQQKTVAHLLSQHMGRTLTEDYSQTVRWRVWLPVSSWQSFSKAVVEATAGAVDLEKEKDQKRKLRPGGRS
jgi:putative IMPACT (imprinted ancient) family translation regulator